MFSLNYYTRMSEKQAIFTQAGGRVLFHRGAYAPTSDPVWLAAYAAQFSAKTVLDVGVGSGGAILNLMRHRSDVDACGIDVSPDMLGECDANAALNGRNIELINADIITWKTDRTFDLVISNPPYFKGTPAKHECHHNVDLAAWTCACARRVRPRGHICIISDAAATHDIIAAMAPRCGDITIFPLFGASNSVAERVIISGRAGTRGRARVYRGVNMSDARVLRDGLTIPQILGTVTHND